MEQAKGMFRQISRTLSMRSTHADDTQDQPPPVPQGPQRERQASVTNAQTIADALNSGDKGQIREYMSRHMIQMANPMMMEQETQDALPQTTQWDVREKQGTADYRDIGDNKFRQIKTFELFPHDD